MSVDVFSERHRGINKWFVYFCITPSSILRLRAFYIKYKKKTYVTRGWSPARYRMFREWYMSQFGVVLGRGSSLDSLPTKEQRLCEDM